MTAGWACTAPAKVNLCLYVGGTRHDGRHELVSVMENVDLHDTVTLAPADADEVVCPGVDGPNLAADALAAFRAATGWDAPPVRITIAKRIPIAGGMAGGSADAAAALRLAAAAAGVDDPAVLEEIAAGLGADVPSQVRGGRVLAEGAGERLTPSRAREQYAVLVVPLDAQLSAGAVYREFDRMGLQRAPEELTELRARVAAAEAHEGVIAAGLVDNDLERPARSLCPPIAEALEALTAAGAQLARVSGSGPTVFGLFPAGADLGPALASVGGHACRLLAGDPAGRLPVRAEAAPA